MIIDELIIEEIVIEEDRITLYGEDPHFHVIANKKDIDDFEIGKKIFYEPCGVNFGWYKKIVQPGIEAEHDKAVSA